jgi:hypothetical protein
MLLESSCCDGSPRGRACFPDRTLSRWGPIFDHRWSRGVLADPFDEWPKILDRDFAKAKSLQLRMQRLVYILGFFFDGELAASILG